MGIGLGVLVVNVCCVIDEMLMELSCVLVSCLLFVINGYGLLLLFLEFIYFVLKKIVFVVVKKVIE